MRTRLVRIGVQALAIVIILIGIVGLFLPFLQGVLFIVLGLYLFSIASPRLKGWLDHHMSRFPRLKAHVDRQHARLAKLLKLE